RRTVVLGHPEPVPDLAGIRLGARLARAVRRPVGHRVAPEEHHRLLGARTLPPDSEITSTVTNIINQSRASVAIVGAVSALWGMSKGFAGLLRALALVEGQSDGGAGVDVRGAFSTWRWGSPPWSSRRSCSFRSWWDRSWDSRTGCPRAARRC